jgi:hypothetical protein
MTTPPGKTGWIAGTLHAVLGGVSLALAGGLSDEVVSFPSDGWKVVLGATGAFLLVIGLRLLLRAQRGHREPFTAAKLRRRRAYGWLLFAMGVWFLVGAESQATWTVLFRSWADAVYSFGGLYLIAGGLALQVDPSGLYKRARVLAGEGVPATATVLHAHDRGTLRGLAKVRVEMAVDVDGRVATHTAMTLLDRERLARLEGATVDVMVDRSDPAVFTVRWDTLREAPPGGS